MKVILPSEEQEQDSLKLEEIFSNLEENLDSDELGVSSILTALELPESEFALLSEIILNELEKSLNNIEDKMTMVQALNASGLKAEDLTNEFAKIVDAIDESLQDELSQSKISFLKRYFGLITEAINATEGIAKRIVPVAISYCREGVQMPKYANAGDAGMDVFALEDYEVKPGETIIIPTGFQVGIPLGYELQVRPRSGMSAKTKMRVANSPGTIDANFRGEVGVIIENTDFITGNSYIIEKGSRFAQLVLSEVPMCLFYEVADIKEIEGDRAGGFGSSGK